jgi:hypothetical protein
MSSFPARTVARPTVRVERRADRQRRVQDGVRRRAEQRRTQEAEHQAARESATAAGSGSDRRRTSDGAHRTTEGSRRTVEGRRQAAPAVVRTTDEAVRTDVEAAVITMQATVDELRAEGLQQGVQVPELESLGELVQAATTSMVHDQHDAVDHAWAQFEAGRARAEHQLDAALDRAEVEQHTVAAVHALMGDAGMVAVGATERHGHELVLTFEDLQGTERLQARLADAGDGSMSVVYCGDDGQDPEQGGRGVARLLLDDRLARLHEGRSDHGIAFDPVQQAHLHVRHTRRGADGAATNTTPKGDR